MKRIRWACCSCCLLALLAIGASAWAQVVWPREAVVFFGADVVPPPPSAPWRQVELPHSSARPATWYRVDFDPGLARTDALAVYLPYLYTGGRLFVNDMPLAHIQETGPDLVVRWERPHLVPIPTVLLRQGVNRLLIRTTATPISASRLPLLAIGPSEQLLPRYENRLFWVRTMSQFTVISCFIVGALSLFIWWRRREEALYGLFGAASLLWGVRTLSLVIEVLPSTSWYAWRTIYHAATGGFVMVLLLFALCLAGWRAPRLKWVLLAYWLLGPLGYLASAGNEALISRYWAGGLLPVGIAVLVISATSAWRQRTPTLIALSLALAVAVVAGTHDYLITSAEPVIRALAPQAAAGRVFLLHYAADILLVVMGGILSLRLVGTLEAIEHLNRTLESRVAQRETALASYYERMRQLEREHAAGEERQQIMRELHDGLGSQLFITLSRVEAGAFGRAEIVQALRDCIADMRLTLEAMSPVNNDFLEAWGNFRFRWQQLLEAAGLASRWDTDADDELVELAPHVILQLLRIVQEALTNVLKHAQARTVSVRLQVRDQAIGISVEDDGRGLGNGASPAGRGLANMRARAQRVNADLIIAELDPGLRIAVTVKSGALASPKHGIATSGRDAQHLVPSQPQGETVNRNLQSALALTGVAVVAAAATAALIVPRTASADDISMYQTPFVGTKTRADVQNDLLRQSEAWKEGADELRLQQMQPNAVKSSYTREQARDAYKASRDEVNALTSEDSGSSYLKMTPPATRAMGGPAAQ